MSEPEMRQRQKIDEILRQMQKEIEELRLKGRFDEAERLFLKSEEIIKACQQASATERKGNYYAMYIPSIIASLIVGIMLMSSTIIKPPDGGFQWLIKPSFYLPMMLIAFATFIIGRFADIFSTLYGIDNGAMELNPGLPTEVNSKMLFSRFYFAEAPIVTINATISGYILLAIFGDWQWIINPFGGDIGSRNHQLLMMGFVGCFFAFAIAGFSAALSNMFSVAFGTGTDKPTIGSMIFIFLIPILYGIAGAILFSRDNTPVVFLDFVGMVSAVLVCGFSQLLLNSRYATRSFVFTGVVAVLISIPWRIFIVS